ncbi:hypothetical protein [Streptomyces sp. NPDC050848]|uniref:hypothetical protein n=1 Tax=Streptomyces sp. NPDC050848 TaxID=3155791 RepID=UPI0033D8B397
MRTRIRHGLAAVVVVSALSLTAACGGGEAQDDTKKDKAADKPAAGQTTSAAPSTAPAATAPLTAAQMKAGVLELKDLPSGWKAVKADEGPNLTKVDKPECLPIAGLLAEKLAGATLGASGDFESGGATTLNQKVLTFAGTGATDFVTKLGGALGSCTGFGATAEGMKVQATVEKLTAPQGAEEAHALRVKLSIADFGYATEVNLLVARQGTGVIRLAHDPAAASGHKDFDALAKIATDKFVKGAKS